MNQHSYLQVINNRYTLVYKKFPQSKVPNISQNTLWLPGHLFRMLHVQGIKCTLYTEWLLPIYVLEQNHARLACIENLFSTPHWWGKQGYAACISGSIKMCFIIFVFVHIVEDCHRYKCLDQFSSEQFSCNNEEKGSALISSPKNKMPWLPRYVVLLLLSQLLSLGKLHGGKSGLCRFVNQSSQKYTPRQASYC